MKENNISAYIVCTQDFHGSEYVGDYFKEREYLSGFTGSAGTIVVLEKEAALWTDGRYFLQAEKELEDSDIDLMKMFQPDVPEIDEYLFNKLSENGRIAFDGRTVSIAFAEQLNKKLSLKNISFVYDADYIDDFWEDRPELSKEPVWRLSEKYAGVDSFEKMRILRKKMSDNNTDVFVLSALDEIAWLLKPVIKEIKKRFGNAVYTTDEHENLEDVVVRLLKKYDLTVTTAESCTGGLIAGRIVNVPGASEVFNEGYVTYSNKAKKKILGVSKATLKKYGAVSEQTAREMAAGGVFTTDADACIAVTGIAGPDGGTEEKPVGLVYIACYMKDKVKVEEYHFRGNREKVREQTVIQALDLLRRSIIKNYKKD